MVVGEKYHELSSLGESCQAGDRARIVVASTWLLLQGTAEHSVAKNSVLRVRACWFSGGAGLCMKIEGWDVAYSG